MLPLPPVSVDVIRKLLSTIKKLIRMLSGLESCTVGTQVHLIYQDTLSILSLTANESTDPDTRFQVSSVFLFSPVAVSIIRKLLSTIKKLIRL